MNLDLIAQAAVTVFPIVMCFRIVWLLEQIRDELRD